MKTEYKLWILKNYLIPSKRFLLTVHTLPMTHLKALDTFVDQWIKKWAGVPKSATNAVIHLEAGLDIPSISTVYTEAHNVSHARTRLQGDMVINHVLDHTLTREETYTHMHCRESIPRHAPPEHGGWGGAPLHRGAGQAAQVQV